MILYHGSNIAVTEPQIIVSNRALDFGAGFYTTSSEEQAIRWAKLQALRRGKGIPTVSAYEFDDAKASVLSVLRFPSAEGEWLRYVTDNRKSVYSGEKYDVVILDPPAFTKSRNSVKHAMKGYREINMRGLKLVKDGGFLATCSCSHFMTYELFTEMLHQAARSVHKRLRQVEYRTQAADHPILWSADESYYLKFYVFQVVDEK